MKTYDFGDDTVGVGILFDGPSVAIYVDHHFNCSFDPAMARSVAKRLVQMADIIDPPKPESL